MKKHNRRRCGLGLAIIILLCQNNIFAETLITDERSAVEKSNEEGNIVEQAIPPEVSMEEADLEENVTEETTVEEVPNEEVSNEELPIEEKPLEETAVESPASEEVIIEEVYIDDQEEVQAISEQLNNVQQQELSDILYAVISSTQNEGYLSDHGVVFADMKQYLVNAMVECKNINRNLLGNKITISTYPVSQKYKFTPEKGAVAEVWYYLADNKIEIVYDDPTLIQTTTAQFNAVVDEILMQCQNAEADIDKELIVHDYLVANYEYDHERLNNGTMPEVSYSAYGLLVNKIGVCQGYAYGMKYLLREMGIDCDVVAGGGHAWNIVTIDGENYYVDATWDDPVPDIAGKVRRNHFNVTTKQLSTSGHIWDMENYPECTSERYRFLQSSNEYIHSDDLWFYNTISSEYIEGTYRNNNLYRYNTAIGEEQLLAAGPCTNLRYDEREQKIYYTQSGEETYYDCLAEKIEKLHDFVNGFYQAFLNRAGEAEGIRSWSLDLIDGVRTGAQLAEAFCTSQEFRDRNLSDEAYIKTLYEGLMGRAADQEGIAYWKQKMTEGLSPTYVLQQFVNSEEFTALCEHYQVERGEIELTQTSDLYPQLTAFVTRLYNLGLERKPDQEGLNYWVEALEQGELTGTQLAETFMLSDEFIHKELDAGAFVDILYPIFFDRESDEGGKAYWLQALVSGESRENIIKAFIDSKEYKAICEEYYIEYR